MTGEVEQTLFKYDAEDTECNRPRQVEFVTGCCIMISRAVWERVGDFAEEYFLYLKMWIIVCDLRSVELIFYMFLK